MQYIILDMEWNQPWPGSYSAKKALPSPMRGEIVQIGAVRMTQEQQIADEFQILIRPQYFKKMNRKVAYAVLFHRVGIVVHVRRDGANLERIYKPAAPSGNINP